MRKRNRVVLGFVFLAATSALASSALASNVSHPATYTGTASTGGTVEFDVSSDGSAVTRFVVSEVPVPCGIVSFKATGSIPIVNDSFRYNTGTYIEVLGKFPEIQQARGALFFYRSPPGCYMPTVEWTATTPTPPPDETPPNTKITSGPKGTTRKHKATFRFASTEPGSAFQCKLDGKKWANCKSPKTYGSLKVGKHAFKVKATDAAGNVDPRPVKRNWRVD